MADKVKVVDSRGPKKTLSEKKKSEFLEKARKRFEQSYNHFHKENTECDEDIRFAINYDDAQWDAKIKAEREGDIPPRPCLVTNKIPEKIDIVEGEFRQIRPGIKIKAVDSIADPQTATIIGDLIRHIEYNSDAETAYITSYVSKLHCGKGAWRIDIEEDRDDPFVKNIVINRIPNALTVYSDPNAKKLTRADAKFKFIIDDIPKEEYEDKYGDTYSEFDYDSEIWHDWMTEETVRIAEYWEIKEEDKNFYRVERNGRKVTVSEESLKKDENGEVSEPFKMKTVKVPKVYWSYITANEVIEGPHEFPGKFIPIIEDIGKFVNVGGKDQIRGMVRFAKEPQRQLNYFASNETEEITLAPKIPFFATAKMVEGYEDMYDNIHSKNYPWIPYNIDKDAPSSKPYREPPPQINQALIAKKQGLEQDIMSAMQIYKPSLGDASNETSGKAIKARQRQGSMGSFTYLDNFKIAYKFAIQVIIGLIPYVYDTERVLRIRGENEEVRQVPVNAMEDFVQSNNFDVNDEGFSKPKTNEGYFNDLTVGKYDVVVSMGKPYTTTREELNEMLVAISGHGEIINSPFFEIIIETMDMPDGDKFVKRLQQIREESAKPDPVRELEAEKIKAEIMAKAEEVSRKAFDTKAKFFLGLLGLDIKDLASKADVINKLKLAEGAQDGSSNS